MVEFSDLTYMGVVIFQTVYLPLYLRANRVAMVMI